MTLTEIPVSLPQKPYKIVIESQGIDRIGPYLSESERLANPIGKKILVVSNPQIWKHYGERVVVSLDAADFDVTSPDFTCGENDTRQRNPSKKSMIKP